MSRAPVLVLSLTLPLSGSRLGVRAAGDAGASLLPFQAMKRERRLWLKGRGTEANGPRPGAQAPLSFFTGHWPALGSHPQLQWGKHMPNT